MVDACRRPFGTQTDPAEILWGAVKASMTGPALAGCAVFMLGLAGGRLLSFVLDGVPHWLLIVYFILEIMLGTIAVILLRAQSRTSNSTL